jgi:hypothetical protein
LTLVSTAPGMHGQRLLEPPVEPEPVDPEPEEPEEPVEPEPIEPEEPEPGMPEPLEPEPEEPEPLEPEPLVPELLPDEEPLEPEPERLSSRELPAAALALRDGAAAVPWPLLWLAVEPEDDPEEPEEPDAPDEPEEPDDDCARAAPPRDPMTAAMAKSRSFINISLMIKNPPREVLKFSPESSLSPRSLGSPLRALRLAL